VRALLRIRDFRLLWTGQATSYLGDGLTSLTLLIVTQRLTGSVTAVAATAVAIALPQLIFGLMAGVYVDRWNRKTVMIISDLVRGILVFGFLLVESAGHMWWLYTLAFVQASVGTFFTPAKMAFVPAVVGSERLLAANSLGETTRVVAMMLGTAVAGVIAGAGNVLWIAFVIDGVTFVTSALFELRIATDGQPPKSDKSRVWSELTTGLRMAVSSRLIVGLMVAAGVLMFGLGAVNVLIVPFLIEDLGFSEAWFGPLEAAQVAGLVLAGTLMTILARRARPRSVVSLGLAGLGVSVAAFALVAAPWHMLVALFMIGWFLAPVQASVTTLLQTEVADELRGRIGSMFSTVVTFTNVASMALAGAAAALLGIRGVFVLAGTVALLSALLAAILLRSAPVVPATDPGSAIVVSPSGRKTPGSDAFMETLSPDTKEKA
jgi:MFS family permease